VCREWDEFVFTSDVDEWIGYYDDSDNITHALNRQRDEHAAKGGKVCAFLVNGLNQIDFHPTKHMRNMPFAGNHISLFLGDRFPVVVRGAIPEVLINGSGLDPRAVNYTQKFVYSKSIVVAPVTWFPTIHHIGKCEILSDQNSFEEYSASILTPPIESIHLSHFNTMFKMRPNLHFSPQHYHFMASPYFVRWMGPVKEGLQVRDKFRSAGRSLPPVECFGPEPYKWSSQTTMPQKFTPPPPKPSSQLQFQVSAFSELGTYYIVEVTLFSLVLAVLAWNFARRRRSAAGTRSAR